MTKKEQRDLIRKLKSRFSEKELENMSRSVLSQIEKERIFTQSKVILLYYSLKDEVCTHSFIQKWYQSKTILLPKVTDGILTLHPYTGKECLVKSPMNILEPSTESYTDYSRIELAIVPGIAFDEQNYRLGRGGGFYDRLFSQQEFQQTPKIGVAFSFQKIHSVVHESHDIPMNKVLYSTSTLP